MNQDISFMKRCIELAEEAFARDDLAFGSVLVKDGKIVVESMNQHNSDVSSHAEVVVLRKAQELLETNDLSEYTLYSNCEPCAMCSYLIRELKIKRVVFGSRSPVMGGYSKWQILQDPELENLKPFFGAPPEIQPDVLAEETSKLLERQQQKYRPN